MSLEGALAAHRFGLGARVGEIDAASGNPRVWLVRQLEGPVPVPASLPAQSSGAMQAQLAGYYQENKDAKAANGERAVNIFKLSRGLFLREMAARFLHGFTTDKPFAERLVWFWSNHLSVSGQNPRVLPFIGAYEREAIRPNVLGRFEDMVLASARHPAMLIYLNNNFSIGPHSPAGANARRGLNENYGRELMELHTLGVDGGYSQADVIALATILTGWSINPKAGDGDSVFKFFPQRHEPGEVSLLGKTYPASERGGVEAIRDLANHPRTARHIARKFAAHFISEAPSQASVDRLAKVFLDTRGDLKALTLAAIDDPAAWVPAATRIRPPVEFITAAARALDWSRFGPDSGETPKGALKDAMEACRNMGQFPFSAPAPTGWADDSASWSGPDAILNRAEWAHAIATRAPKTYDPMQLAAATLGPLLSAETRTAIERASSGSQGLALLIASPELQRR